MSRSLTFYEFFAGGGMARLGLGEAWDCTFANDFDAVKTAAYRDNFGGDHLHEGDVFALTAADLPGEADLAWASSPCQDFSLAGKRSGLSEGSRSSAFHGFWRLMQALNGEGRAPRLIVIENVVGLLTANGGADFAAVCRALAKEGYRFGALEIDASRFLPQSRPRLFIVASRIGVREGPSPFHTRAVRAAQAQLPPDLAKAFVWWDCPPPPERNINLAAVLEADEAASWRSVEQTERLLALMPKANECLLSSRDRRVGTVFRRMRPAGQRAELRLDGVAGCLRTPRGGSSRQILVVAQDGVARSRLISPREGARLMGLPDSYKLPATATRALHLIGDGVAVPVVRHLSEKLLRLLLIGETTPLPAKAAAA